MDENLPSEAAHDNQPFSSTFFVPIDEPVSMRRDAIQIQQISLGTGLCLQLIAEDKILQAHPVRKIMCLVEEYLFFTGT